VIQNLDLQQMAGPDEIPGDSDIGLGGGGISAWVIVGENDGVGTGSDGGAENLACMNEKLVEEALRHGVDPEKTPAGVEQEHLQTFHGSGNGVIPQEGGDRFRVIQDRRFLARFLGESAGESEGGFQPEGFVATDSAATQLLPGCAGNRFQAPESLQQFLGNGHGGSPTDPGPEKNGQQFGVSEGIGSAIGQSFPGAIGLMKVENAVIGRHGVWEKSVGKLPSSRIGPPSESQAVDCDEKSAWIRGTATSIRGWN